MSQDQYGNYMADVESLSETQAVGGGSGGGSGSGTQQVYQGDGDPTTAPDDPTFPAMYTNRTNGQTNYWNVVDQSWQ